jgi:hypothetical protein
MANAGEIIATSLPRLRNEGWVFFADILMKF